MNRCIKKLSNWFDHHPTLHQWAWFAVLWLGGLLAVTAVAYPIKWLMKNM